METRNDWIDGVINDRAEIKNLGEEIENRRLQLLRKARENYILSRVAHVVSVSILNRGPAESPMLGMIAGT